MLLPFQKMTVSTSANLATFFSEFLNAMKIIKVYEFRNIHFETIMYKYLFIFQT